jgi:ribosomal protein L40E
MKCSSCNSENKRGAVFCRVCGVRLEVSAVTNQVIPMAPCVACGFGNPVAAKVCGKCGSNIAAKVPLTSVESGSNQKSVPTVTTPSNASVSEDVPVPQKESETASVGAPPVADQEPIARPDTSTVLLQTTKSRTKLYVSVAIVMALAATGGGSYFVAQYGAKETKDAAAKDAAAKDTAAKDAAAKDTAAKDAAAKDAAAKDAVAKDAAAKDAAAKDAAAKDAAAKDAAAKDAAAKDAAAKDAAAKGAPVKEAPAKVKKHLQGKNAEVPRPEPPVQPPPVTMKTVKELCASEKFRLRPSCECRNCAQPAHQQDPLCIQRRESMPGGCI